MIVSVSFSSNTGTHAATNKAVSSAVTVTNDRYDFGEIDIFGGKVQTTYTLKNEGSEVVTVIDAQTSCMCTEGEIAGFTFGMHGSNVKNVEIQPGDEEEVTAIFDPLAHGPNGTGKITRELMLKTNSTESPVIRLMFTGEVIKTEAR